VRARVASSPRGVASSARVEGLKDVEAAADRPTRVEDAGSVLVHDDEVAARLAEPEEPDGVQARAVDLVLPGVALGSHFHTVDAREGVQGLARGVGVGA